MTPQEKAGQTLRQHKEAQKQKREEQRAERELIRKALKEVLTSETATPAEKLESSKLLLELDR